MYLIKIIKPLISCSCMATILLSACGSITLKKLEIQTPIAMQLVIKEYNNETIMANTQIIFNKDISLLGGWNYVKTYPDEFTGLALTSDQYRIDNKPVVSHGESYYATTLIKKFGDWHHQHANGITAQFSELTFSKVAGVEFVLRINTDISNLPSREEIAKTYNNLVSNELLAKLDDSNVHLSFALTTEAESIDTPQFNAEYLLSLDAKKQVNCWLYVFIPVAELTKYNDVRYQKTSLSEEDVKSIMISDFRLVAETRSTKVIRNLIPDTFDFKVPKLFKEIGVEIRYIGIVKKH